MTEKQLDLFDNTPFTLRELRELALNWKPTKEDIERMQARAREMEKKFEQQAWDRRVTNEMLNRSYSI